MAHYAKEENIYAHAILILVLINAVIWKLAVLKDWHWYWVMAFTVPLLLITAYKNQKHHK
ncbi:MAG: hypothetical protein EOP53_03855 [Sphingobacteriales bacterium]|nr:MAG: hypothetical protein EOP53_03855 [Sphingobacteriales bacterium]